MEHERLSDDQVATAWVNVVHSQVSRMYHTNSRIAGVHSGLPRSTRVEHAPHEEFSGTATLRDDPERRDHVLTKVEAIPGLREENDFGFKWQDPVTGEMRGGLVALPPLEWSHWDHKKRCWTRKSSSSRLSQNAPCWQAMNGPLPEGRVSSSLFFSFSTVLYSYLVPVEHLCSSHHCR